MRDKQIEEMQEMASILTEAAHLACEDVPLLPTDTTMCDKIPCHRCKETRLLRYKGYRKASDVAREIFEEIDKRLEALLKFYPCNGEFEDAKRFVDFHWKHIRHSIMCDYDAELKKKYESEGEG